MIFLFPLLTVMMSLTTASIPLARGQEFRPAGRPIPVILDTDIGDDIDDTWALGFLLKCPELDLKLVVGDAGKPQYRAHLLAKFLQTAGRSDVAIGVGLDVKPKGEGGQSEWIKGYELRTYPGKVHADGVQAIIDTIMNSKEPVKAAMEWKNLEGFRDLLADRLTGRPSKKLPGPRNGS